MARNGKENLPTGIDAQITPDDSAPDALEWQAALLDLSFEPIFAWDWEQGIIKWNAGAERMYGFSRNEVLGQNSHELLSTKHPISLRRFLKKLDADGYWIGEIRHTTKDGRELIIESRQQIIVQNGRRVVMESNRDITERRAGEGQVALLIIIGDLIRRLNDPGELLFAASKAVGQYFEARRCFFNEIDLDNDLEIIHRDFCRGVKSLIGKHKLSVYSPITTAQMTEGVSIANADSKEDPRTAKLYKRVYEPTGERSYISVPLMRDGQWKASLWISDDRPREWSKSEITLLEIVGERIWNAVEKSRNEAELRRIAEFDEAVVLNMAEGLYTVDSSGLVTTMNHAAEKILGWKLEELRGQKMHDVTHHHYRDGRPFPAEECAGFRVLHEGRPVTQHEDVFIRKDGAFIDVVYSSSPLRAQDGIIIGLVVVFQDVTEKKKAEDLLERYRLLSERSDDIIWFTRPDGRFVEVNRAAVVTYGYTRKEFLMMNLLDLRHPSELRNFKKQLDSATSGGVHFETLHIAKNGTAIPVEVNANASDFGGERLIMAIVRNITDRKRSEERIAGQNRILEALAMGKELTEILDVTAQAIERIMPGTRASVLLADAKTEHLYCGSAKALPFEYNEAIEGIAIAEGIGSCGTAAFRLEPVIVSDISRDPLWKDFRELAASHDLAACWSHPILAPDGKLLGTFGTYFAEPRTPKYDELTILESAARLAGIAIHRRHTEESLRSSYAETERQRRLYDTVLSNTPDLAYVFGLDHRFKYANKTLLEMWDKTWEESIGKNCLELGYEPWHAEMHGREIDHIIATRETVRGEVPFDGAFGRRMYDYILVPVIGANGDVEAVAGTTRDITDNKLAENALRESEERRKLAQEAGNVGIFDWDRISGETYWSETMWSIYGHDNGIGNVNPDEAFWTEHLLENDRERVKSNLLRVLKSNENDFRDEFRIILSDGSIRWIEARAAVSRDGSGTAIRMYGVNTDITSRKEAEEKVRLSDNQLRLVTNAVPALISYIDKNEVYRFANQRFTDWFGVPTDEVIGKGPREVFGADAYAVLKPYITKTLSGERCTFETVLNYKGIGDKYVHISYIPDTGADGTVFGYYGLTHDLTELKQSEELLRSSEERLGLMMESLTDYAIFSMDSDGVINSWNKGAEIIFGYSHSEILGQFYEVLFTTDDAANAIPKLEMGTARRKNRASDERWLSRKDGENFFAHGVMMPLHVGKAITGYVKIVSDLTEKKRHAEELQRAHDDLEIRVKERTNELAESNAALVQEIQERETAEQERIELLGRLVSSQEFERRRIARDLHDQMGQRLTALRLKLASLHELAPGSDQFTQRVERLQEIAQLLDSEVSFLTWELRPTTLDDLGLLDAIAAYVNEWSRHYEVSADFHSSGLPKDRLDREIETHLYRISQEALTNIAKHADAKHVTVLLERREQSVILIIEDDGKGFDPAKKRASREYGKGLGLVGMGERAILIGGEIEIESSPGKGTTIYVRVPFSTKKNMSKKLRILLAEDHQTVREGVKLLVNAQPDMEVVGEAGDGEIAIKEAERLDPDIIVMDVSMPNLNGLKATKRLRRQNPDIKILTLTRHTDDGYLQQLIGAGSNGYVLKQSAPTELITAIRTVAAGNAYLDPSLTRKVMGGYVNRSASLRGENKGDLTDRENEVLKLVSLGYSNKEIAARIELSVKTIESHKTNAMKKLGISSRIDIVRYAILQDWLQDN